MIYKKIEVKVFLKSYLMIVRDDGIFFESKEDENHFFIPCEAINTWDGICLEERYFLKTKYSQLFSVYIVLFGFWIITSVLQGIGFLSFFISMLFIMIVGYFLYIRIFYFTLFADYEKIIIKMNNNEDLCFVKKFLEERLGDKDTVKNKIATSIKYRINNFNYIKNEIQEEIKEEIKNLKEGKKNEEN